MLIGLWVPHSNREADVYSQQMNACNRLQNMLCSYMAVMVALVFFYILAICITGRYGLVRLSIADRHSSECLLALMLMFVSELIRLRLTRSSLAHEQVYSNSDITIREFWHAGTLPELNFDTTCKLVVNKKLTMVCRVECCLA